MTPFRWGIFGTGAVSAKFAAGLASAQGAIPTFVASRTRASAERFAAGLRIPRAITGYEEAARQGGVDAVYIATPQSEHAAHAVMCLEAGLPVLVEKPFAASEREARLIADTARARSVFAMEAMWTRFLPAMQAFREQLDRRAVGEVRFVTGNFGTSQVPAAANGMFNPALGGGAVRHLGVYPVSHGQWLFGTPTLVQATGRTGQGELQEDAAFQMRYPGGVLGSYFVSLRSWAPDTFQVLGDHGMICVRGSIVRPNGLHVFREAPLTVRPPSFGLSSRLRQHRLVHRLAQMTGRSSRGLGRLLPYRYEGNGYHYEADEVRACISRGAIESTVIPLDGTIAVAATLDSIADQISRT